MPPPSPSPLKSIICSSMLVMALFWCDAGITIVASATAPATPSLSTFSGNDDGDGDGDGGKGSTDLLDFPALAPLILSPVGSARFQPHNSDDYNERSAYDPGDELLRALNAESVPGIQLDPMTYVNGIKTPNKYEILQMIEDDLREEQDVVRKSAILVKLLEDPMVDTLPLLYIEEYPNEEEDIGSNVLYSSPDMAVGGMAKRSRYYRRYPWKRHSRNRSTYEPEMRYACTPSKEDVFKLLMSLHENRKGNQHKTVNFCNRKRPAKAIFTNIRFLG